MKFLSFQVRKGFILTIGSLLVIFFGICMLYKPPLTATQEYEKMFKEKLPAAFEFRQTVYQYKAANYALEGNLIASNAAYDLAIHYDKNNPELYFGRAILKIDREQYDLAIKDLDKAYELSYLPSLRTKIKQLKKQLKDRISTPD